jgi:DNA-binding response OmpR family regulator
MNGESRRVLIIEDDLAIARVLDRNLQREGFDTRVAHDGADAAAILDREAFDYILCDYQLPDTTGADLCRQIRASATHRDVPLALCTAKAHEVDTAALIRELGLTQVFFKPFSLREIAAAIDAATTAAVG